MTDMKTDNWPLLIWHSCLKPPRCRLRSPPQKASVDLVKMTIVLMTMKIMMIAVLIIILICIMITTIWIWYDTWTKNGVWDGWNITANQLPRRRKARPEAECPANPSPILTIIIIIIATIMIIMMSLMICDDADDDDHHHHEISVRLFFGNVLNGFWPPFVLDENCRFCSQIRPQ